MKKLATIFDNMKVSAKIALGFAVVLCILAIVGIRSYVDMAQVGEHFKAYTQRVAVADVANDIDRELLAYRRTIFQALTADDPGEFKAAIAADEERVKAAIARSETMVKKQEQYARVESIKTRFAEYTKLARETEGLRSEKDKIIREVLDNFGA